MRRQITITLRLDVDLARAEAMPGLDLGPYEPPVSGLEIAGADLAQRLGEQAKQALEALDPVLYLTFCEVGPLFSETEEF